MYSVPHFFVIILLLNKFGNVGIHYLRLVIYLYTAISGNPSKLLEIVCPNPISLASAAPIRPTLLPLRAKKKPPMPWKKPLMSFQVPSIKDVDISFLIFWHLLLLSIIFFFWKTSMKFDPLHPPPHPWPPQNYWHLLWTAPDFSESPAALPLRYLQTLTQISSTLVGMAIWVVKFSREGYKIRCIFSQKSIYLPINRFFFWMSIALSCQKLGNIGENQPFQKFEVKILTLFNN